MRYVNVSTAALLMVLIVASAVPASASNDFDSWWRNKSGEIDGRWTRAALREAGVSVPAAGYRSTDAARLERARMAPRGGVSCCAAC